MYSFADELTPLQTFQGFLGYSLKDIFQRHKYKSSEEPPAERKTIDNTRLLREVLAGTDDPNDKLTGYWELFDWPVPPTSESMRGRRVEKENLLIYYRSRSEMSWHGLMTHVIGTSDHDRDGPLWEPPLIANYHVELQETNEIVEGSVVLNDKEYIDSTTELDGRVKKQKAAHHKRQFHQCKVEVVGATQKFSGKYQTEPKTGEVDFICRGRKRWSQLQNVL